MIKDVLTINATIILLLSLIGCGGRKDGDTRIVCTINNNNTITIEVSPDQLQKLEGDPAITITDSSSSLDNEPTDGDTSITVTIENTSCNEITQILENDNDTVTVTQPVNVDANVNADVVRQDVEDFT